MKYLPLLVLIALAFHVALAGESDEIGMYRSFSHQESDAYVLGYGSDQENHDAVKQALLTSLSADVAISTAVDQIKESLPQPQRPELIPWVDQYWTCTYIALSEMAVYDREQHKDLDLKLRLGRLLSHSLCSIVYYSRMGQDPEETLTQILSRAPAAQLNRDEYLRGLESMSLGSAYWRERYAAFLRSMDFVEEFKDLSDREIQVVRDYIEERIDDIKAVTLPALVVGAGMNVLGYGAGRDIAIGAIVLPAHHWRRARLQYRSELSRLGLRNASLGERLSWMEGYEADLREMRHSMTSNASSFDNFYQSARQAAVQRCRRNFVED